MANNLTKVDNGTVQPRFYQVYGDLIESKEIMEPTSIVSGGSGPICGFDWVDTTKASLTIQSVWNAENGDEAVLKYLRGRSKRVMLSTKENTLGQVYNAYVSPAGLLYIAPGTLIFTGVNPPSLDGIGNVWPDLTAPNHARVFCIIAKHTYTPMDNVNPPSTENFRVNWFSQYPTLAEMLSWNLHDVLEFFKNNSVNFSQDQGDILIGFYLVGWSSNWDNDSESARLKPIYQKLGNKLCLNPYGGKLPVSPYLMNPFDIPDIKADIIKLKADVNERFTKTVNDINDKIGKIETSVNTNQTNINTLFTKIEDVEKSVTNLTNNTNNQDNSINNRISGLEEQIRPIDGQLSSIKNSRGEGVEIEYTIQSGGAGSDHVYKFTKLIIQGCTLATSTSSISKNLSYQAKQNAFGLILYSMVPIAGKTSLESEQWGIATAEITNDMISAEKWDGSINFSTLPTGASPLALFDINIDEVGDSLLPNHAYTLINNTKVDGPTRLALCLNSYLVESPSRVITAMFSVPIKDSNKNNCTVRLSANTSGGILAIEVTINSPDHKKYNHDFVNLGNGFKNLAQNKPEWKPVLEYFFNHYYNRSYGLYGDSTPDNHLQFYVVTGNPQSIDSLADNALYVDIDGHPADSPEDRQSTILTFPIDSVVSSSGSNFLKLMANPFKQ